MNMMNKMMSLVELHNDLNELERAREALLEFLRTRHQIDFPDRVIDDDMIYYIYRDCEEVIICPEDKDLLSSMTPHSIESLICRFDAINNYWVIDSPSRCSAKVAKKRINIITTHKECGGPYWGLR